MANVIYRGPIQDEPQTVNLPVAGAYLPGILVTSDDTELTVATAADNENALLVLSNARFLGQDVATAYASGDTGVAYTPRPNEKYQIRMAAATYTIGQNLSVGASGYLVAATTGDVVVARSGVAATLSAGDLADVTIANSFVLA